VSEFINPEIARQLRGKKLTIVDLIRREGREPGGKPCAQVWVVKWGKETRYLEYPTLEPIPIRMLDAIILTSSRWWRFKRRLKNLFGRLYSLWRSWS
jgi:hypothetical protein